MEFSTYELILGLVSIILLIVVFIALTRFLIKKSKNKFTGSRKTYLSRGLNYSIFLKFGLVCSLLLALLMISWTTYHSPDYEMDSTVYLDELELVPSTIQPPAPPPPPPPKPVIPEVVEPEEPVDEVDFIDMSIEVEDKITAIKPVEVPVPESPPVVPELPGNDEDEPFLFVEQMPRFPGCEQIPMTKEERTACTETGLMKYIYDYTGYPALARENNIQGRVVVRFVVRKDGSIGDVELLRGIGGGCDEAVINAVKSMNDMENKWTPGMQRGVPVPVIFTLPVTFKLQG